MAHLLVGDVDKYGPRGTGEYLFMQNSYTPEAFLKGQLAESWEITPDKMVFYLKPGTMWAGNPRIGMEPRELTAEDIAWSMLKSLEIAFHGVWPYIDEIYAPDRYTLVFDTNRFYAEWFYTIIHWLGIFPPELYAAGVEPADWRNLVSIGPFILTDYVAGSKFEYERNPLYFDTTTIDGVEYQLPFIDKLIFPVIVDVSTQIAALRTGALDADMIVPPAFTDTLDATSPEMLKVLHDDDESLKLALRSDRPPFNDIKVRRAMWRATDLKTINDTVFFGLGVLHNNPMNPMTSPDYVSMEDLPPSGRELYDYNPEIARQMLAEAGYTDGFSVELVYTAGLPWSEDILALLVDQWAKVNVEIIPVPMELGALYATVFDLENGYKDTLMYAWGNSPPFSVMGITKPRGEGLNHSRYYDDEVWAEMYWTTLSILDMADRTAAIRELAIYYHDLAIKINMPQQPIWTYGWKWLKNKYARLNATTRNDTVIIGRERIDK